MDSPDYWQDECPGILNWALQGLAELRQQGCFTQSQDSAAALEDYRQESNPARGFIVDNYRANQDAWVSCESVYKRYCDWCKNTGYSPLNIRHFGREICRVFKSVERTRRRDTDGTRFYLYQGLSQIDDLPKPEMMEFDFGTESVPNKVELSQSTTLLNTIDRDSVS